MARPASAWWPGGRTAARPVSTSRRTTARARSTSAAGGEARDLDARADREYVSGSRLARRAAATPRAGRARCAASCTRRSSLVVGAARRRCARQRLGPRGDRGADGGEPLGTLGVPVRARVLADSADPRARPCGGWHAPRAVSERSPESATRESAACALPAASRSPACGASSGSASCGASARRAPRRRARRDRPAAPVRPRPGACASTRIDLAEPTADAPPRRGSSARRASKRCSTPRSAAGRAPTSRPTTSSRRSAACTCCTPAPRRACGGWWSRRARCSTGRARTTRTSSPRNTPLRGHRDAHNVANRVEVGVAAGDVARAASRRRGHRAAPVLGHGTDLRGRRHALLRARRRADAARLRPAAPARARGGLPARVRDARSSTAGPASSTSSAAACCRSRRCCAPRASARCRSPRRSSTASAAYPVAGADGRRAGRLLRLPALPVGRRRRARASPRSASPSTRRSRPGCPSSRRAACGATGRAPDDGPRDDPSRPGRTATRSRSALEGLRRELRGRFAARGSGGSSARFSGTDALRLLRAAAPPRRHASACRSAPRRSTSSASTRARRARARRCSSCSASAGGASRCRASRSYPPTSPCSSSRTTPGSCPYDGLVLAHVVERETRRRAALPRRRLAGHAALRAVLARARSAACARAARTPQRLLQRGHSVIAFPGRREGRGEGVRRPLPPPALRPRRRGARRARGGRPARPGRGRRRRGGAPDPLQAARPPRAPWASRSSR